MPEASVQLLTEAVVAVFRANGQLISWGERFAAPFGLTSARWQMLGALALAGQPATAPQIAATMGVTRQGAQKQLNLLLKEGLIGRQANPTHKRSPLYHLTGRGRQVYGALEARWNDHARTLAASLPTADLEAACRVLAVLVRAHAGPEEGEEGDETAAEADEAR